MNSVTELSDPRPRAFGGSVLSAAIRTVPEDFVVEEILGFEASGEGEHLFLDIEKRGANTVWVAQQLARWAGVAEHAVSYAGLKDRHAVTRQSFTVHLPKRKSPDIEALAITGVRVLKAQWHQRKLPRGALRGNRFGLLLRDVQGEREAIDARLKAIAIRGVPNAFGEQRFGRDAGNVDAARAMFAGRRCSRDKRSIYLSAARSALFNRLLDERIRNETWDVALPGEVLMLDGTHSVFGPEPVNDSLKARVASGDVHPTGAMWGAGELRSTEVVRALEEQIAAADSQLADGLVAAGLKQERRALRLPVKELTWEWRDAHLFIAFQLPAGSYATSVLDAMGTIRDASRDANLDINA